MSTVVFLAGLGQPLDVWAPIIARLPVGLEGIALPMPLDEAFSIESGAQQLRHDMDAAGISRAHICGLSLGAMVGLKFAAEFPDRTGRLILSGGQVHHNAAVVRVQIVLTRLVPERLAFGTTTRAEAVRGLRAILHMDLREDMRRVQAQTLVLCGRRDLENLGAARDMAAGITGAELDIIPGVGHVWNKTHPTLFAEKVGGFLTSGDVTRAVAERPAQRHGCASFSADSQRTKSSF